MSARDITAVMPGLDHHRDAKGSSQKPSADSAPDPWTRRHSLSLDGGGVRGYSSLLILQKLMESIEDFELETDPQATSSYYPEAYQEPYDSTRNVNGQLNENRKEISGSTTKRTSRYLPCHYFDFIAGTSTGGLIAIMLARLRLSVDEALEVFKDMSKEVFSTPRAPVWFPGIYTYNHRKLEKVIKKVVDRRIPITDPNWVTREKNFLSELNDICNCLVVAYGRAKQSSTPYLFRSYMSPEPISPKERTPETALVRNAGVRDNYPIWMVARATSAAPGYLRKVEIQGRQFIDGGFGCNNPSVELYDEVKYLFGPAANALILSIGTGVQTPPDKFGSNFGILADALKMATDSQEKHEAMQRLQIVSMETKRNEFAYHRFNVKDGMGTIKLGAYRELGKMETKTREYLLIPDVLEDLRQVAKKLVDNRKNRYTQNRDRWEDFCCETRYRCSYGPDQRCQYGHQERTRHRFREHLERDHRIYDIAERERLIKEVKNLNQEHIKRKTTGAINGFKS